ncbi:MAG: histidine phosphatase family protein [bacterium]|nr:histidine phosphatase family protein [bacterium]
MALHLIRHGETDDNARRVVQLPDAPLSARGRAQAQRLAARLRDARVARILSSDYRRARETADAVAAATGLPVELEPLLRERHFGDVRGRAYAELGTDIFAPDYAPPGGETWDAFFARVAAAWTRVCALAAATPGPLAVITHGLVCWAIVGRHAELAPGMRLGMTWGNTSVTDLEGVPPRRVTLLDSTSHLDGLATGGGPV